MLKTVCPLCPFFRLQAEKVRREQAQKKTPTAVLFSSNRNDIFTFAFFRNDCKFISISNSKQQTLPLFQKWQTQKISTCLRRLENELPRGWKISGSYQLLKFLPICFSQTFIVDPTVYFPTGQIKKSSLSYPFLKKQFNNRAH